jgi:glycosyltransferase involved in cell wall biosynthesis
LADNSVPEAMPMVSFVVPAYNEQALIARTLHALREAASAAGEPYEIIVVDDASSDRTAAIAEESGARVIPVHHRQIAATRNTGGRAATGDLLIFVDADTVVNRAVVCAAIDAMRRGAIGGGCSFRFDGPLPKPTRAVLSLAVLAYRVAGLASGCYLFCTREAFEAVGGFDERLYVAEEYAMCRALKRRGRFVVLKEHVTTSGRKLRAFSGFGILRALGRLVLKGHRRFRDRQGMELWYGARRDDPGLAGPPQEPTSRVSA